MRVEKRGTGNCTGEVMIEIPATYPGLQHANQMATVRFQRNVEHRNFISAPGLYAGEQLDIALDPGDELPVARLGKAQLIQTAGAVGVAVDDEIGSNSWVAMDADCYACQRRDPYTRRLAVVRGLLRYHAQRTRLSSPRTAAQPDVHGTHAALGGGDARSVDRDAVQFSHRTGAGLFAVADCFQRRSAHQRWRDGARCRRSLRVRGTLAAFRRTVPAAWTLLSARRDDRLRVRASGAVAVYPAQRG